MGSVWHWLGITGHLKVDDTDKRRATKYDIVPDIDMGGKMQRLPKKNDLSFVGHFKSDCAKTERHWKGREAFPRGTWKAETSMQLIVGKNQICALGEYIRSLKTEKAQNQTEMAKLKAMPMTQAARSGHGVSVVFIRRSQRELWILSEICHAWAAVVRNSGPP